MKDKNSQPRPSAFVALSSLLEPARVHPQSMPDPKDGPPCHLYTGRCCKYFALQIDTPTTPEEYDHVRWYLLHQGIVVWMQGGDWYLEVRSPCRHLLPGNQCGIYEKRPAICRTYGLPDEPCEFFTDELKFSWRCGEGWIFRERLSARPAAGEVFRPHADGQGGEQQQPGQQAGQLARDAGHGLVHDPVVGNAGESVVEERQGSVKKASLEALSTARGLADELRDEVTALCMGGGDPTAELAQRGADRVLLARHELLAAYSAEAFSATLVEASA